MTGCYIGDGVVFTVALGDALDQGGDRGLIEDPEARSPEQDIERRCMARRELVYPLLELVLHAKLLCCLVLRRLGWKADDSQLP